MPPKTTNGSASQSFDSNSASAVPSHQSSVIRKNRRKVRPQYPSDSDEKHVEYILVASFDIDRGSVMEHQYPAAIGGDEHMLAELMLPDQAHVRSQDWTMFFLHKDTSGEQQQDKSTKRRRKRSGQEVDGHDENDTKTTESEEEEGYSEEEEGDEGDEHEDLASTEGPPLVYVLNLVNTKQDNTAKRSAYPTTVNNSTNTRLEEQWSRQWQSVHGIHSCTSTRYLCNWIDIIDLADASSPASSITCSGAILPNPSTRNSRNALRSRQLNGLIPRTTTFNPRETDIAGFGCERSVH